MGFKAAGQTKPGGQLMRLAEKIDLLRQRPAIVARQQIDKARVEAAGLGEAGLQARQMLLGRFMLGGSTPPPLKRMAIYSSPDACRRSASCRRSATVNGTRASMPQQPTRCSSSSVCGQGVVTPQRVRKHFSSMAASSGVLHAGQDAEHLVQQVGRQLGGITAHVVGGRDLDQIGANQVQAAAAADDLQRLNGGQTANFRRPGSLEPRWDRGYRYQS